MYKKLIILFFILGVFLLVPSVLSANIHGTVYDFNLNTVENAVIEVDSVPKQVYVSKDGMYSFNLAVGEYVIKASYEDDYKKYIFKQNIVIQDEGDYVFDLILFPDISEETELFDEDIILPDVYRGERRMLMTYIGIALLVILSIIAVLLVLNFRKKKKYKVEKEDPADDVLAFIKKQGGRVTQKDIRKQFPVSEAKVSLIIAELQHKGVVKKIKRGRGNIIILEKK